jgi:hypothetical protein
LDHVYDQEKNDEQMKGRFSGETLLQRLPHLMLHEVDGYSERSYFGSLIGFLHPYSVLNILAICAQNKEANVVWQYGPLVENGWAMDTEFIPCARRAQTFLIATEGSSDVHVLKHAFSIIYPEIEDFFRFIDVKEGHPFPGTGNLAKFAVGLARIDVQNMLVFLFDNDGEGYDACQRIKTVSFPSNMRAIMLPEMEQFRSFRTRGPQGVANADINKRAAAIECYLDLNHERTLPPQITWMNYKKEIDIYHGALDNKEVYIKAFLKQTSQSILANSYDISKIRTVLDSLISECHLIASKALLAED